MFGYVDRLRSRTQGRATYTMQFSSYVAIPPQLAGELLKKLRGY